MRRAFTMVEVMLAVVLVGMMTALCVMTFHSVSRGWQISTDYMDKMQRTDYALDQVVSDLRSMYYPAEGEQDENHGFILTDNGSGENPDDSDVLEWSKASTKGASGKDSVSVHRLQILVLEEGDSDYAVPIEVTGLYKRTRSDLTPEEADGLDEEDLSFDNKDLYPPELIADGIVGFNCRVLKTADEVKADHDKTLFEDEYRETKSVPYKVELTFHIADPEGKSYRSNTAPVIRIVRLPMHEQSLDGAAVPGAEEDGKGTKGGGK